MTNNDKEVVHGRDWIRIASRTVSVFAVIVSFLVSLMMLWFFAEGDGSVDIKYGAFGIFIYILGLLVGTIVAWSKEKVGGIIIIIITIALTIWLTIWPYIPSYFSFPEMLLFGGPPLLAGVLFLLSDRKAKREAAGF